MISDAELSRAYTAPWDEEFAEVIVPAHSEHHEEKWDGAQLNVLANDYGGAVRDLIVQATTRKPQPVKITPNKPVESDDTKE